MRLLTVFLIDSVFLTLGDSPVFFFNKNTFEIIFKLCFFDYSSPYLFLVSKNILYGKITLDGIKFVKLRIPRIERRDKRCESRYLVGQRMYGAGSQTEATVLVASKLTLKIGDNVWLVVGCQEIQPSIDVSPSQEDDGEGGKGRERTCSAAMISSPVTEVNLLLNLAAVSAGPRGGGGGGESQLLPHPP